MGLHKLKNVCLGKKQLMSERQPMEQEKIFADQTSKKMLIYGIYKIPIDLKNKMKKKFKLNIGKMLE